MSFWKSLFGGGASADAGKAVEAVEYNGFTIKAAPFEDGAKWMTAGTIEKQIGGETKTHRFIRADSHATFDAAASFSVDKARQMIDLMGDRLFGAA
jgi:hypothetical protein